MMGTGSDGLEVAVLEEATDEYGRQAAEAMIRFRKKEITADERDRLIAAARSDLDVALKVFEPKCGWK